MTVIFTKVTRNICSILINRPEKRNAINIETFLTLRENLRRFEDDEDLRVAILSGVGGNFSAGYDLNNIITNESLPNILNLERMLLPTRNHRLSENKITIAAIDGHAAGIGFELALRCDLRVAERDSRMGFMNRRFGIPIMNGGTVILPRLIGLSRACDLVATGKAQPALESFQYGVINYIADVGCALGRATSLARCLTKFNQSPLVHDLISTNAINLNAELILERKRSLEYLKRCGPLKDASKFLSGELFRHGSFDMGNLSNPNPEVTL